MVHRRLEDDGVGLAYPPRELGSVAGLAGPVTTGGLYALVGYWAPFVAGGLAMMLVVPMTVRVKRRAEGRKWETGGSTPA